jgi:hypothetical protein
MDRILFVSLFLLTIFVTLSTWYLTPHFREDQQRTRLSLAPIGIYGVHTMGTGSFSQPRPKGNSDPNGSSIHVAHVGNSIQYYNDCPRLLEHMLRTRFHSVQQDSCFRGGASFSSLLEDGNGMRSKFSSRPEVSKKDDGRFDVGAPTVEELLQEAPWDVVIMNDYTQGPARPEKKRTSLKVLKRKYIPMFEKVVASTDKSLTVIFIQTAAYLSPVKDSEDLGSFDEFTEKLRQGYQEYEEYVNLWNPKIVAKVAPVGLAYQYIKNTRGDDAWAKLYARDDFHPGPLGTYLEACVLYCTIVGEAPPKYDVAWWATARYMQPPEEVPLPLPTDQEAAMLWGAACHVCEVDTNGSDLRR